jgi:hypothetical protein
LVFYLFVPRVELLYREVAIALKNHDVVSDKREERVKNSHSSLWLVMGKMNNVNESMY